MAWESIAQHRIGSILGPVRPSLLHSAVFLCSDADLVVGLFVWRHHERIARSHRRLLSFIASASLHTIVLVIERIYLQFWHSWKCV
ncbi:hypothetical protein B0T22DRAFT_474320 [Podospora appendiculata]|uniref:Uncharacterized protein n=1 Tax=Podospora appendiculata TaxID=314037 RepID=A0AAE0WYW7_9PEZI|nr:hypothetical protein B0T22DRAFT_474320 [Podospora appendiculata]